MRAFRDGRRPPIPILQYGDSARPDDRGYRRSACFARETLGDAPEVVDRAPPADALARHERDFPQGELEEERGSLEVQALVGLQRYDQAQKVGARFRRRFPRNILGAVVDEALRSIP